MVTEKAVNFQVFPTDFSSYVIYNNHIKTKKFQFLVTHPPTRIKVVLQKAQVVGLPRQRQVNQVSQGYTETLGREKIAYL